MKSYYTFLPLLIILDIYLIFAKKDYTGSSVIRVDIKNETQLKNFHFLSKTFGYEVEEWGPSDIFVPNKNLLGVIQTRLRQHGLMYKILIEDVGKKINEVEEKNKEFTEHRRRKRAVAGSLGDDRDPRPAKSSFLPDHILDKYPTFKEITGWLHEAKVIAKPILQVFTLGQTYEKNDIFLLKIGLQSNITKPALWFDFGVHAREWISVSTGIYTIYNLLEEYMQTKIETVQLLNKVDIYIMPVANPDGYIYSHVEDRMWRKNRTPDKGKSGCTGTDINRNFAYHWGEVRASCYPCDSQYRGPSALSELESQAIASSVQALSTELRAYVTVHSYSQMWLTRWGYTEDENDDFSKEVDLASKAVQTIRNITGKEYLVGSSSRLMYRFSGGAADWAKGSVGIKYAFGIELRDTGEFGFILPVEQIDGTGREFLAALKAVAKHVMEESKDEDHFYKPINPNDGIHLHLEDILNKKTLHQNTEEDENNKKDQNSVKQQLPPKISTTRKKSEASSLRHYTYSLLINAFLAKTPYKGGTVLRIHVNDNDEAEKYMEISKLFEMEVDAWSETDVFISDDTKLKRVFEELRKRGLKYEIIIHDVGQFLEDVEAQNQKYYERRARMKRSVDSNSVVADGVVGKYATYDEIVVWLNEKAESNDEIMSVHTIGQTYEQRDLVLVKLGKPSKGMKPAIWMDFGIHAREWVSPATATYMISQLLTGWQGKDSSITRLLEEVDFYLLPITNPDGYVYTHEVDRMWRKNRSPDTQNAGCVGTDLNRNFPFMWGGETSSDNQCVETFRGPAPLSEKETIAIETAARALGKNLQVYLTVHSYSQLWMTGWSYSNRTSENHDEEMILATKATDAIYKTTKKVYKAGPSPTLLYKYSGGSPDWAKGELGVKYSFCVELRDKGKYGFILPADQILDTGAELFAAVRAVGEHIAQEASEDPFFYQGNDQQN